jgi:hypothetical protein
MVFDLVDDLLREQVHFLFRVGFVEMEVRDVSFAPRSVFKMVGVRSGWRSFDPGVLVGKVEKGERGALRTADDD